jgi:hypothetical protein
MMSSASVVGHFPQLEAPDRVADAILEFFAGKSGDVSVCGAAALFELSINNMWCV